jgi:hypothetical protein
MKQVLPIGEYEQNIIVYPQVPYAHYDYEFATVDSFK